MCRFSQRTYASSPTVPTQVRHFLIEELGDAFAGTELVDDAVLVVSELATNAFNAGSTRTIVDVALHRNHIQLAVTDDAPGHPAIQNPSATSTHGRGLQLVSVIATRWGTDTLPHGKTVWAQLTTEPSDLWACTLPEETSSSR